uniref:Uncharacterized protein n=1 Tax=Arundo donax TaxID=35708 RepID=A0A0A9U930_ARUDO
MPGSLDYMSNHLQDAPYLLSSISATSKVLLVSSSFVSLFL